MTVTYASHPVGVTSTVMSNNSANATLQASGNTSLTSIDGKIPANLTVASTRLLVDGSGVVQPVSGTFFQSVQPVSFYQTSNSTITASATITTVSVVIIAANPNRKGLILYNNSANSVYISYAATGNAGTSMTAPIAAFASFFMPYPIYTGAISGIRNSGTGVVVATELT